MKLNQLAAKPKLIKIILDDEEIVKEFGESIEFHTFDRQPMENFLKLASIDSNNVSGLIDAIRTLVLDENGKQVLTNDIALPNKVMMKVVAKVVEGLGKS